MTSLQTQFGPTLAQGLRGIADGFDQRPVLLRPDAVVMRTLRLSADELDKLHRVAEAARVYFNGYMQDEAADDMGWVCDRDQHERAAELRDALAALNRKPA